MSIFSPSPHISCLSRFPRLSGGFTLIELLISGAIITIITGIVLVRFNGFDGTVLIKSLAYEIASSVREAQVYSVSVINTGSGSSAGFRYPYGLSFSPGNTSYLFFRFADSDKSKRPYNDLADSDPDTAEILRTIPLENNMEIYRVCIKRTGQVEECRTTGGILDISFRRPEFSAIFNASWIAPNQQSTIEYARVEARSSRSLTNIWAIEVKLLGQISVFRCTATTCP